MENTQANLRRRFPVYGPSNPAFQEWLAADSNARVAWIALVCFMARIDPAIARRLLDGG